MRVVSNGCGPNWLPVWAANLLFNWFFEADCYKHDEGYQRGGDEIRRFECDWKFYKAMKRDTLKYDGVARFARWIQAITYFALVRAFGWKYFNYKTKG